MAWYADAWIDFVREHYPGLAARVDAAMAHSTEDTVETAIPPAAVIAALESDREALRRVVDGLAARLVVAEADKAARATPEMPVVVIEPPDPLVWAVAAHPWLRDPKANWRMGL